jgi:hypothetical protein
VERVVGEDAPGEKMGRSAIASKAAEGDTGEEKLGGTLRVGGREGGVMCWRRHPV